MQEVLTPVEVCEATIIRGGSVVEDARAHGTYHAQCFDKDGNLLWEDDIENTVMNEGKAYILNLAFQNSLTQVGGTFVSAKMGLVNGTPTYTVTDTYASHAGWTEANTTLFPTRQTCAFTVLTGPPYANSITLTSNAQFVGQGSGLSDTVIGCCLFFTSNTATGNTAAANSVLVSAGNFSSAKTVGSGDTIAISYTFAI